MMAMARQHTPVLPEAVIRLMQPRAGGVYLDGTTGAGGHSALILQQSSPDGRLYAVDRDTRALQIAREKLAPFADRVEFHHTTFLKLDGIDPDICFDGILLDLGVSSMQLDDPDAGFSFRNDGPLDMRMDQGHGETAAELVNTLAEVELRRIISEYGEERFASRIARAIVNRRGEQPFERTGDLAGLIRSVVPQRHGPGQIDPATRSFQALRIAVNDEIDSLEPALRGLARRLAPGGRLVVISFHSLEDRIVKWLFRELSGRIPDDTPPDLPVMPERQDPEFRELTRKPLMAEKNEEAENPRSRSAKIRALIREGGAA